MFRRRIRRAEIDHGHVVLVISVSVVRIYLRPGRKIVGPEWREERLSRCDAGTVFGIGVGIGAVFCARGRGEV